MAWWKVACSFCGAVVCAVTCVATGGLAAPAIVGLSAATGFGGFLVGDSLDKETTEQEKRLMEDKRYRDTMEVINKQHQENNQNQLLINDIAGKLNGNVPRQAHETDEYLQQQLIIAQNNLKNGENRLAQLTGELDELRKQLGGGSSLFTLLGLDKLSTMDKVMIAGGIVLVIYLVKK